MTFRKEAAALGPEGNTNKKRADDMGPDRYLKAFKLLQDWIEKGLEIYKVSSAILSSTAPASLPCVCWLT